MKEADRHKNLQPGNICLLMYDKKVKETYRLCRVIEVKPGEDGLVRTVKVAVQCRKKNEGRGQCRSIVGKFDVGVKRLVLIADCES